MAQLHNPMGHIGLRIQITFRGEGLCTLFSPHSGICDIILRWVGPKLCCLQKIYPGKKRQPHHFLRSFWWFLRGYPRTGGHQVLLGHHITQGFLNDWSGFPLPKAKDLCRCPFPLQLWVVFPGVIDLISRPASFLRSNKIDRGPLLGYHERTQQICWLWAQIKKCETLGPLSLLEIVRAWTHLEGLLVKVATSTFPGPPADPEKSILRPCRMRPPPVRNRALVWKKIHAPIPTYQHLETTHSPHVQALSCCRASVALCHFLGCGKKKSCETNMKTIWPKFTTG